MRRIFLLAAVMLYFPGCTPEPPTPLTVGTCIRIGCEPFYLARDLDYFNAAPIRIVEYNSATEVLRAFRNRAINAAALSLDEVLQLAQHVPGVRIVLVMNYSNGADVILGGPTLKTLADIRGKRVGVENTALGAYVLARALQEEGLARRDIHLVPLPVDQHERAFLQGQVDAVVTFEPVHSRLEAQGAHHLFDSRQIPKEMVNVLAVHTAFLEQHPESVRALLQGWFKALARMDRQPADSLRRMALSRRMSPPDYAGSLNGYHFLTLAENHQQFSGKPSPLVQRMQHLSGFMLDHQLLRKSVALPDMLDSSPLDKLPSQAESKKVAWYAF
jgi:NitT/TauT family transport system substrate-binding protein